MDGKTLPGFNAENAIYRSRVHYSWTVAQSSAAAGDILLQLRASQKPGQPSGSKEDCDRSCVCITGENCPCCYSLGSASTR